MGAVAESLSGLVAIGAPSAQVREAAKCVHAGIGLLRDAIAAAEKVAAEAKAPSDPPAGPAATTDPEAAVPEAKKRKRAPKQ
jgi:hypothetical protein